MGGPVADLEDVPSLPTGRPLVFIFAAIDIAGDPGVDYLVAQLESDTCT